VPLYEYECKKCHHRFEKIQSFSDPEEKVCPKCGGEVERLISPPAVQFKGTGWYVTDYARKSGGSSSKSESSGSDSKSSESKSETRSSSDSSSSSSSPSSSSDKK